MDTASKTNSKTRRSFIRRVTAATAWGEGLDGYDLGAISVVAPIIAAEFGLSAVEVGLLGASTLAGIFFGGPIFGHLTDRVGRRRIFFFDLIAFVILGALQGVVTAAWQLLVLRLLLGMAIGAEYSIGPPMLAEFSPTKGRGRRMCSLQVCWYTGFLAAVVIAYIMVALDINWRWILASGALPALVTLVVRWGLPESPRWLMSQGREEEAREIVDHHLGKEFFQEEELGGESTKKPRYRDLFAPELRSRTAFVCIFYTALVAPYFAIFTFAPLAFESLGMTDSRASVIGSNALAVLGALAGMFVIEQVGRRSLLITCFWVMVVTLGVIGAWGTAPAIIIVACFVLFAFFNAISGNLTGVYPSEVFPSELRGTGVGLATATSRVGAAAGTFLLPVSIDTIGVGPTVLIGAAIAAIGAGATHLWAPETTHLSLTKSPKAKAQRRQRATADT